ncbi:MAG: BrnT family toxin [Pseudomonadota bacterium]|nr:BrnT family toxin [Pseudomonadota bacterium]MDE3036991.1 BrnT family toxin [Pseudomonadota bacterium]
MQFCGDKPYGTHHFEWDENKNILNVRNHGIAFESALKVFSDRVWVERSDRKNEERYKAVGLSEGRIITVIFTRRTYGIRIISARTARKKEKIAYRALFARQSAH